MTREQWTSGAGFFLDAHGVEHFTALEICPVGKLRAGATLTSPPPDFMLTALKLIDGPLGWIRWYQEPAPVHVNSWFRSTDYNRAVGGGEHSMHLTGGAVDFTKDGWTPAKIALALHNDYPMSEKLGIGLYEDFVHVDIRGLMGRRAPARWSGGGVGDWWLEHAA